MALESQFTWMDGKLIATSEARFPFLTSALHYGLGAFEGIRCYETPKGPAVFRLAEHAKRLVASGRALCLEQKYDAGQIAAACIEVVKANGFRECYLRPLIFAVEGGWNLSLGGVRTSTGIAAWEWKGYLGEDARAKGIRANVSSFARHHPNVMMTKAKITGNYANSALAKTESLRLGFDEAIMLDPTGCVSECTGANIFIIRDGTLITPPKTTILEGITRDSVMHLAQKMGHAVLEDVITRDQLYGADEVFVCGTAAEVIGVRDVDARPIGTGVTGPITRALEKAFHGAVRGENPERASWLTPVN